MNMRSVIGGLVAILLALTAPPGAGRAAAQDFAFVAEGNRFDKSFLEAAFLGALEAERELGVELFDLEVSDPRDSEKMLRAAAERSDLIVAVGFQIIDAVEKVAAAYPDRRFTLIDGIARGDNVQSILFAEHEGAFLVGALAAMVTQNATVGFVGGMDTKVIRNFHAGYAQGAQFVNPKIRVLEDYAATPDAPFNDPYTGMILARRQIDRGADVIFAAAGATGLGVYQAARDAGVFAIGVDSNQNFLYPGTMLTSMLKRADRAVRFAVDGHFADRWRPGIVTLGLREEGVGYALDSFNLHVFPNGAERRLSAITERIVAGELAIPTYYEGAGTPTPGRRP